MFLKCLLGSYAFFLFWGIIFILTLPSLVIYFIVYPFLKYPQDTFQNLASVIYKIFFKLLPIVKLDFDLLSELPKGAIYVSTHQSSLDYPILGYFIKHYLTVTNLNFTIIPLASFVGELIGARSLKKNSLGDIAKMYNEFEDLLNDNRNIIIFPEGTRGDGKKLRSFKKGAFRLAMKTDKPIVPIIIDGTAKIVAKGDYCFKTTKKTIVKIKMLSPVKPKDFDNEIELLKYVHNLMEYKNNA